MICFQEPVLGVSFAESAPSAPSYAWSPPSGQDAATTYIKLAEVQVKLESKHEVATAWVDAANCYRKVNPREATRCLQQAVQIYMQLGRLGIAAKHLRDTAEVLEKDGDKQVRKELSVVLWPVRGF